MSAEPETPVPDMIRWTFTPEPSKQDAIVAHLTDLGFGIQTYEEGLVIATWDEPEDDLDAVVERLWTLHGGPFEITHEEFQRTSLLIYQHEENDADQAAA